jgi:hypothetical protein
VAARDGREEASNDSLRRLELFPAFPDAAFFDFFAFFDEEALLDLFAALDFDERFVANLMFSLEDVGD